MAVKLPWWAKIGAKLALSRLPFGYRIWQRFGLFRHGSMDRADYAVDVFNLHMHQAGIEDLDGKTILEIGPGDSIASAIIASSMGARSILVDSGAYATEDIRPYQALSELLRSRGLKPPVISEAHTFNDVLELCNSQYMTNGIESWRSIASDSVDFVFSQAVIEHVRRYEFIDTQRECFRVVKPGGVVSHRVDLKDHLGGGLNNLRFSERLWESALFSKSGFYTNRIQYSEMMQMFEEAGFVVIPKEVRRWNDLPIKRSKLAVEFRDLQENELNICGFDVLLKRA